MTGEAVTFTLRPVNSVDDGGDGKPWTLWALVGHVGDQEATFAETWSRTDATTAESLEAVFQRLRLGGGPFG